MAFVSQAASVLPHQPSPLQTRSFDVAFFHVAIAFDEFWNARDFNSDDVMQRFWGEIPS